MTDDSYRQKWESTVDKRLDHLGDTQMRLRADVGKLEMKQDQVKIEVHDTAKAVAAIGKKLDAVREELPLLHSSRTKVESVVDAMIKGAVAILIGVCIWAVSKGAVPL